MRTFALFVALLAGALLLAAALTYPAWLLVGTVSVEPVHRVMHRLAMLIALIGLFVLTRRLGLANRSALGYGLPPAEFFRQLGIGWAAGIGLMLPLVALLLALDVRQITPGLDGDLPPLLLKGIVSGFAVAFIEETFFRGILFSAVARTSSARVAIIAPTLLYAALHFLGGKLRVPPEEVSWIHGFEVLSRLFERYAQPLAFVDSFLALVALGVLLSMVRLRTGAIAGGIGLHAAGVCAIFVLRDTTVVNSHAPFGFIVGQYDGVIGWAACVWFVAIVVAYGVYQRQLSSGSSRTS
ncbi:MAG TPA: CPBP family intramembrane glutamic endopeptidase [Steroidobacteraceae bacterium]|nr:CPBP family intramembrane glutamic endopeptidase [Steroidobacteraceae bacterium]